MSHILAYYLGCYGIFVESGQVLLLILFMMWKLSHKDFKLTIYASLLNYSQPMIKIIALSL